MESLYLWQGLIHFIFSLHSLFPTHIDEHCFFDHIPSSWMRRTTLTDQRPRNKTLLKHQMSWASSTAKKKRDREETGRGSKRPLEDIELRLDFPRVYKEKPSYECLKCLHWQTLCAQCLQNLLFEDIPCPYFLSLESNSCRPPGRETVLISLQNETKTGICIHAICQCNPQQCYRWINCPVKMHNHTGSSYLSL